MLEQRPASDDVEMTFTEHLAELRRRLFIAIGAIAVAAIAGLFAVPSLLRIVEDMFLRGIALHVFSPTEIFRVYIKLSLLIGVIVAFPVVLYQVYAFVAPALDRRVRSRIVWYAIPSFFMSALGLIICGVFVLPFLMSRLLGFTQNAGVVGTYQLEPTVGFVTLMLGIFAIMFQLPIVLSILASVGLVNARGLAKGWRYATLAILIAAAIAAPDGNPITMGLLAAPLLALYALSVIVVRLTQPKISPR
ncbi:MAG: twin-arginine translocase subunit TatC [Candidatus Eremiobacteraeota bacterium]|nr:twin-arginine translocase subunit TatC [Candidatus Eremiobacteraeota bacterium]MBV8203733.1 twin-arginine translocase subunit TatC [Candidatus Eremiobacteraeota bacterium]MBV8264578.1 twin-arginine translocase subunit TatC [Candidatus Eremiobacteraeota bacterium]MBV8459966.1 twin-arginine translocase subunit TatC [Candidatus Eremiobacteraeota bacterium]